MEQIKSCREKIHNSCVSIEGLIVQMNVLSVFDGMSCGQIALERAGIKVDNYFASEIDKWAIQVTQSHYPNTIQLGNILEWKSWKLPKIDLLIGGSPCQGFSNAGKGLNFEDPRSKLFFTYVDILKDLKQRNPELLFLLENVRMKKEWQDIITGELGVESILIDSALVSAQSRKRCYWTNFFVSMPKDKKIFLRDIVQPDNEIDEQYIFSTSHAGILKLLDEKAGCLTGGAHSGGNHSDRTLLKYSINGAAIRNQVTRRGTEFQLNIRKDGKSNCVVSTYPNKLNGLQSDKDVYRRLTPLECERLQTVPEGYTEGVSNTQRYKMLGNGWTVDVIAHIFSCLKSDKF